MASVIRPGALPRRWPRLVIGIVVLLFILFTVLSQFLVDMLWYREVGLSGVFWTTLWTKVVLGLIFGLLFFGGLWLNLGIVRRITPTTVVLTPDQEVIVRFRDAFGPYLGWAIPAGAAVLGLFIGIAASREWQTFLLWHNSTGLQFGNPDPLFHRDPSFYVFSMPWLKFVQGWLFSSLVGITLLTGLGHYLWGGIRPQARDWADKVVPAVRAHLSVLFGLIMIAKAWGYWLGRFDLLTSPRGVVEGATYTDVHAQLPALNFLAIVALICAVLFLVNIRVRLWSLPVIAVGLLLLVSVLLGAAYPAFIQQIRVKPQELQQETPYITDNIRATRRAFGLDKIRVSQKTVAPAVTQADVTSNDPTISNIRLWRPSVLLENFQSLQRLRQYYEFKDVDVDRYAVNGQPRVLMVAGREVTQSGIPGGGNWQNKHLIYTHGFGPVAAQVNSATAEGAPAFTVHDIPPVGFPYPTEPRLYYGEVNDVPYVVVGTKTDELDYEGASSSLKYRYQGTGGIAIGNVFERALFAWRYKDINLLISNLIDPNSRIMIYRDIQSRVQRAAPFLKFDGDPYLAIVDGKMQWIWDAYTTTTQYPYSQSIDLSTATKTPTASLPSQHLSGSANYIRNSVKVVVDAYNGTLTYYDVSNGTDPILSAWERIYPGMFTPVSKASTDLLAHFRYPENLFQVQAYQFARYHVEDPQTFFQNQDTWQIPLDPTVPANADQSTTPKPSGPLRPNYVLMRLPDQSTEQFQLILPFTPEGRQNMVAWMAASSDPGSYGNIVAYEFPKGENIDGPSLAFGRMNQDARFSSERTLLGQVGSSIVFGDFQTIPVGNSFLYVQPAFVRAAQDNAIPELKFVLVANGDTVGVASNLGDAISLATGAQTGGNTGPPTGSVQQQIATLLTEAVQHFDAADAALRAGDLGTYQSELKQAQDLVKQANDLAASQKGGSGGGTGSPTPTGSPSATSSP